jgi:hypothetical protein
VTVGIKYLSDLFNQYGSWEKVLRHYACGNPENKSHEINKYVKAVLTKAKVYHLDKEYKYGG